MSWSFGRQMALDGALATPTVNGVRGVLQWIDAVEDHARSGSQKELPRLSARGRLDVVGARAELAGPCAALAAAGIRVSLFIDADLEQIEAAAAVGAPAIELHTGAYAEASGERRAEELHRLASAARHGASLGLVVNAGHGLDYHNVQPVAAIPEIVELNIGFAIIARAIHTGLDPAVREMKRLMREARL